MTTSAQLFALAVSLPSLLLILVLVRRGALRVKYALLWLPVGFAMLLFSAVPGLLDTVAGWLGVAYPPTVLFVMALGLLIFVAVHLSWELSRLDERVRRLAEYLAIQDAEQHHGEGGSAVGSTSRRALREEPREPVAH